MAVLREKTTDDTGTIDLVKTFSTEDFKLKQEETGIVYGKECIDVIAGYDENNIPYSRFTYTETGEKDDDDPETDLTVSDKLDMLSELGVDTDD